MYSELNPVGDRVMRNAVGMVSSFQAMEEDLMILIAGRRPLETRPLGPDSLFDSLRDPYVMAARARCNFIIIASMEYIHENRLRWRAMIEYIRSQNKVYF